MEFVENLVEEMSQVGGHAVDLQQRLKSLNLECQGLRDANQGINELAMVEIVTCTNIWDTTHKQAPQ